MRSLIVLLFFLAGSVTAALADSESDGAAAEKAGKYREALGHYTSALQAAPEGSEKDQQLREKIIEVAAKLKPAPVVPEEVTRFMARGRAAVGAAKDQQSFEQAAYEFRQALKLAPWLADAYYNLGVVLDKAEKYPEAIQNLKLYLHARRDAPDARQVQELIYEVEYRQEKVLRSRTGKQPGKTDLSHLAGRWQVNRYGGNGNIRPIRGSTWWQNSGTADVRVSGDRIRLTVFEQGISHEYDGQWIDGRVSGVVISNIGEIAAPCPHVQKFPFEASIDFAEPHVLLIVRGANGTDGRICSHYDWYTNSFLLRR